MPQASRIFVQPSQIFVGTLALAIWLSIGQSGSAQTNPTIGNSPAVSAKSATRTSDSSYRNLDDAIEFARQRRPVVEGVKDYTAVFTKMELVGEKVIEQTMDIKCRHEPFSVYLRNRSGKEEDREVLYVSGAHGGNLLVHERGLLGSLAGTQSLKLDDAQVMAENRYPITDIGIAKILNKSLAIWQAEKKADTQNAEVRFFPNAKVGPLACEMVEVMRKRYKPGFDFSLSRVYFALDSKLPIRAEQFGWADKEGQKAPLVELYHYAELQANVGLTNADFAPQNPKYGFEGSVSR